jgi:hypothetical protein
MDAARMIGEVFTSVVYDDETVVFEKADGSQYRLYHYQDCCESCFIEQVIGNILDLVGSPITNAVTYGADAPVGLANDFSNTYEIWELQTIKGVVKIACFGSSNGYYSETFDLEFFDTTGKKHY